MPAWIIGAIRRWQLLGVQDIRVDFLGQSIESVL